MFEKRLRFLVFLAGVHGAPREVVEAAGRLARYVLRRGKPPKTIRVGDARLQAESRLRGMYARVQAKRAKRRTVAKRERRQ